MTPASEIIVRWFFDHQNAEEAFVDDLILTLYEGCEKNEADSIALLANIIASAQGMDKEAPWDSIVDMAIDLHKEISGIDRTIHNLNLITEISETLAKMPQSVIARRISIMKMNECIAKLKA